MNNNNKIIFKDFKEIKKKEIKNKIFKNINKQKSYLNHC